MKILRIEDPEGKGPFFSNWANGNIFNALSYLNETSRFPTSNKELGISRISVQHGCQTFDLLLYWFERGLLELAACDFGIAEYEVEPIKVGKFQTVFDIKKAKKLCWIPLKEIIS